MNIRMRERTRKLLCIHMRRLSGNDMALLERERGDNLCVRPEHNIHNIYIYVNDMYCCPPNSISVVDLPSNKNSPNQ